jgi:BirA family biotin operon repressor/biotin-[acetyl-CoA-carboxylase] ligase
MIGRPRAHHREVGSTNLLARELAANGAPHGTLVTADHQSAGRGRSDRAWLAPPGSSVLMSVVIRPGDPLLSLRAAVAVAEVCGSAATIKWPNDVLLEGRKACGILVEGRPQEDWAVLGIGLNVLPVEFPPELNATALDDGRGVEQVLAALLVALGTRIAQPADGLLAAWRERDALAGRQIAWEPEGSGTAAGVDDSGALLVDTADGRVALDAGEVHLKRS